MLGDVSGKGIAAALLMSHLHAIFRAAVESGLADMVSRANRLLCNSAPSASFATLVAARFKTAGTVELCTAGHTSPLILSNKGNHELLSDCLPLGLFCEAPYTTTSLILEPGEAILLYTDGLTESSDSNEREFGTDGVLSALSEKTSLEPSDLVFSVGQAAQKHRGDSPVGDDLTLLAVSRKSL
jgi:sigma-B regulation protein RsbU (phosphoserine phosphatase)